MVGTTCAKCGFTPKNQSSLYFSAMSGQTLCVSGAACKNRRARRPQYSADSWVNPSFEQQMST
jgi:hypothetical protein